MTTVFYLYHLGERQPSGYRDDKNVGVYSTAENARQAIERYKDKPGFKQHPERWEIREYVVDRDDWVNGFDKDTHERIG